MLRTGAPQWVVIAGMSPDVEKLGAFRIGQKLLVIPGPGGAQVIGGPGLSPAARRILDLVDAADRHVAQNPVLRRAVIAPAERVLGLNVSAESAEAASSEEDPGWP